MLVVLKLVVPLLSILLGLWTATQWTAVLLRHAPQLGAPWVQLGGWRVYVPWQYVPWFLRHGAVWPQVFARTRLAVVLGFVIGLAVAWAARLSQQRQSRRPTTFGSSRGATRPGGRPRGLGSPARGMLGPLKHQ